MCCNPHEYLENALQLVLNYRPEILAVVGPTASGKSQLAINLAVELKKHGIYADIVNADAYSRYRQLDIAVAKVSADLREFLAEKHGIRHYQIDVVNPQEITNAAEYKKAAKKDVQEIKTQGRLPIICGGSGLYLRAVLDDFAFAPTDAKVRAKLEEDLQIYGVDELYSRLQRRDPQTASSLDAQNARRIIRALEVIELSGEDYRRNLPAFTYAEPKTLQLYVDFATAEVDARVDARLEQMRAGDLLQEARDLEPILGVTARKAIGYPEMLAYIHGEAYPATGKTMTLEDAYTMIQTHTKRLIRRQRSWFLRDPRLVHLGGDNPQTAKFDANIG
jgi:tRNA dimethylallyltransferase